MNKTLRIVLIIIGAIVISSIISSITGVFKMHNSSTVANEPNLKMNSPFFTSNLVTPKIGDFVSYQYKDVIFGKHMRVHKVCAMENDIIEIKNGIVYLNNENIDKPFEHIHFYKISKNSYNKIKSKEKLTEANIVHMIDESALLVAFKDSMATKYGLTSRRVIESKEVVNKAIQQVFKHNWNKDNFGPLKVPAGKIFVMGDHRDNSEDSRYIGFIDNSDILGVVISK